MGFVESIRKIKKRLNYLYRLIRDLESDVAGLGGAPDLKTLPFRTEASSFTLGANDVVVETTTFSQAITLPDAVAAGAGRRYIIINRAGATQVIAKTSGQTLDGVSGIEIIQADEIIRAISDGSNWLRH